MWAGWNRGRGASGSSAGSVGIRIIAAMFNMPSVMPAQTHTKFESNRRGDGQKNINQTRPSVLYISVV
jgi:hypothetical protein